MIDILLPLTSEICNLRQCDPHGSLLGIVEEKFVGIHAKW